MDLIYRFDYKLSSCFSKVSNLSCFKFDNVLLRYLKRITSGIKTDYNNVMSKDVRDNIVWVFWAQGKGNMPPIVQRCIASIYKHVNGDVRVVEMDTIENYVHLPSFVYEKLMSGKMSYTHFSDILRFALLKENGGWWLDATIFLVEDLPSINSFFTIKHSYNESCISGNRWSSFLWYLPPNHPLAIFVYEGLVRYWQKNAFVLDYLLTDYLIRCFYDTNPAFRYEVDVMPENNPDLYFFQTAIASEPYVQTVWDSVKEKTTIFKTTYKLGLDDAPPNSFIKQIIYE